MKKMVVLGSGCAKCAKVAEHAEAAAKAAGIDYELEKVTDILKFADYGVMMTPGLVVDGEVKASGRVPSVDEIKQWLV